MRINSQVEVNYESKNFIGLIKEVYCKSCLVEFIENGETKRFVFPKGNIKVLNEPY